MKWSRLVAQARTPEAQLRDFERVFLAPADDDPRVRTIVSSVERYTEALALDARLVPLVQILLHVNRSLGFRLPGDPCPVPHAGNPCARYVEALARHTEQLLR